MSREVIIQRIEKSDLIDAKKELMIDLVNSKKEDDFDKKVDRLYRQFSKSSTFKKHAEKMAKSHDWECFDRKDIIFYLNRFSKVQNQGRYQNDETDALKDIAQNSALSKTELIIELARVLCCVPHGRQLGSIYSPWSDFVTYR